jgi:hypothetical protein
LIKVFLGFIMSLIIDSLIDMIFYALFIFSIKSFLQTQGFIV